MAAREGMSAARRTKSPPVLPVVFFVSRIFFDASYGKNTKSSEPQRERKIILQDGPRLPIVINGVTITTKNGR